MEENDSMCLIFAFITEHLVEIVTASTAIFALYISKENSIKVNRLQQSLVEIYFTKTDTAAPFKFSICIMNKGNSPAIIKGLLLDSKPPPPLIKKLDYSTFSIDQNSYLNRLEEKLNFNVNYLLNQHEANKTNVTMHILTYSQKNKILSYSQEQTLAEIEFHINSDEPNTKFENTFINYINGKQFANDFTLIFENFFCVEYSSLHEDTIYKTIGLVHNELHRSMSSLYPSIKRVS